MRWLSAIGIERLPTAKQRAHYRRMNAPRVAPDPVKRYAIAIALACSALAIRGQMPVAEGSSVYQLPLAAVVVSAWLGGRGPGWLAGIIGSLGALHFFVPPSGSLALDPDHRYGFLMFVALELLLIEFSASRFRVQRALQESDRRFRAMAEAVPQMLWFESIEPRAMLYASPRFEQIWGRPVATLQREPGLWLESIHEDDRAEVIGAYTRWLTGEAVAVFDSTFRIVRPDGATRIIHTRATLIRDDDGRPFRASGVADDITDSKRAEEALAAAKEELARAARLTTLGQLAASIAHEVNQPLGAMVANAAACDFWLSAQPPETAKAQGVLKTIIADGRRASAIIGRIREQLRRRATRKEPVDINEVIVEVLALARYELRRNGIVPDTQLDEGLPRVQADKVQLQQVLLNLIVNGMEATTGAEGAHRLFIGSAKDESGGVLVTVSDNGVGLDPEGMERLFAPFYTTKASGMGMGLAISRSAIESHGGRIWASPNTPRGAVFRFSLPAVPEKTEVHA